MDLLLDENNDIDLTNNLMSLVTTIPKQTEQRLNITLYTNQGEWKFNTSFGLPWITEGDQLQLLSKIDKGYVDGVIKKAILDMDNVIEIIEYNSVLDGKLRINKISSTVRCAGGDIAIVTLET